MCCRSPIRDFRRCCAPLPDCPIALFVAGNVDALREPQLAVVGSRNPTAQGRDTAFEFAQYLAERGLGNHQRARTRHRHAPRTAAHWRRKESLSPCSAAALMWFIPAVTQRLSEAVEQQGALVSEFALGSAAAARAFSRGVIGSSRGFSLGTLVVEAARRSGSLITARAANDRGREVFAIPGSIHNPLSRGCHELIKQGAKLTETPDDILTELNFSAFFANDLRAAAAPAAAGAGAAGHGQGTQNLVRCARL